MPKYQLIFESETVLTDDEFEQIIKPFVDANPTFKFLYANNVQGFRKELIEKRDQYLNERIAKAEASIVEETSSVENLFDDIGDIFKLGD